MVTDQIVFGACDKCGTYGQIIPGENGREIGIRQIDQHIAMQDDIAAALRALGLSDHARPMSPHQVMLDEVIPAINKLRELSTAQPSEPSLSVIGDTTETRNDE